MENLPFRPLESEISNETGMTKKTKVVFVGSFKSAAKDGSLGGQMFACQTLIESDLSNTVDWVLIDSTADSNIPAPIYVRAAKAAKRVLIFAVKILFSGARVALIFSADGPSFIEKGTMALWAKLCGKRVIFAPRSGIMVRDVEQSRFMRRFIAYVVSRVDYLICQSQYWSNFFSEVSGNKVKRPVVVQNWINTQLYTQLPSKETTPQIHVLFMSWVDKNKGIFELINAAKTVCGHNKNVVFHIAGMGAAFKESKSMVSALGIDEHFIFHGWVRGEEKKKLMHLADIYVLPSHFEGFPNSLVEAMASKIASISTNVGSVGDIIEHKVNGLIFPIGDEERLADYLLELSESAEFRQGVALKGHETVMLNNSIDRAVASFKEILTECVG